MPNRGGIPGLNRAALAHFRTRSLGLMVMSVNDLKKLLCRNPLLQKRSPPSCVTSPVGVGAHYDTARIHYQHINIAKFFPVLQRYRNVGDLPLNRTQWGLQKKAVWPSSLRPRGREAIVASARIDWRRILPYSSYCSSLRHTQFKKIFGFSRSSSIRDTQFENL